MSDTDNTIFEMYFAVFIGFIVFSTVAFMCIQFFAVLPNGSAKSLVQGLVNAIYAYVNNAFLVIFVLLMLTQTIISFLNPRIEMALVDFISLFVLGYINFMMNGFIALLLSYNIGTGLNGLTSLFTTGLLAFLVMLFLVINIILNLQGHAEQQPQPMQVVGDYH